MNNEIQFILYHLPDEEGRVQVGIKDETIWATQKAMAQLFGVGVPAISKHLAHIFEEGELDRNVSVSKMETTTQHGAYDYDRNSPTTREFYQMIQNRFHYAITGQTAPEIFFTRADHSKEHMGLQTWKNATDGRVLLSDTKVAKNYCFALGFCNFGEAEVTLGYSY